MKTCLNQCCILLSTDSDFSKERSSLYHLMNVTALNIEKLLSVQAKNAIGYFAKEKIIFRFFSDWVGEIDTLSGLRLIAVLQASPPKQVFRQIDVRPMPGASDQGMLSMGAQGGTSIHQVYSYSGAESSTANTAVQPRGAELFGSTSGQLFADIAAADRI
jgi:hypothetical protein